MKSMLTVENAATWFNAKTVTHHLDVVDRQAASIVDTRTVEGSTVRFYNADGFEFMTLKSDNVSVRFDSLFGRKLVGTRHAEDGRLYAILKDGDSTREEYKPDRIVTSFFETDRDNPWIQVVEERREEHDRN